MKLPLFYISCALFLVGSGIKEFHLRTETEVVTVLAKQFVPPRMSTYLVQGVDGKGRATTSVATDFEAEQWIVAVRSGASTYSIDSGPIVFAALAEGNPAVMTTRRGAITGIPWARQLSISDR